MLSRRLFLKRLATLSMFAAISIVLVALIRIPMFLPFLEYDPADIPILLAGIYFGPSAGLLLTVVVSAIHSILFSPGSGIIGFIMHVIATGGMVVICSLIYRSSKNKIQNRHLRLSTALVAGAVFMVLSMIPMNLLLTPIYAKMSAAAIWEQFMFIGIIPYNIVKALINGLAAFLMFSIIYKTIPGRLLNTK